MPAPCKCALRYAIPALVLQPTAWRSHAANPFTMCWSMSRFREHPMEAVMSDALKVAYRDQGFPQYLQAYLQLRERFRNGTLPAAA